MDLRIKRGGFHARGLIQLPREIAEIIDLPMNLRINRGELHARGLILFSTSYTYDVNRLSLDKETVTHSIPGAAAFIRIIDRSNERAANLNC